MESFALTSFEKQECDWAIELFTPHIRSFLGGNKEKLCFNLAKHWSVEQTANTFSRSHESRSSSYMIYKTELSRNACESAKLYFGVTFSLTMPLLLLKLTH